MADPDRFPVIAWYTPKNGKRPCYVAQLPGDGGVDWGFTYAAGGTTGADGRVYDRALPLTVGHWRRFAARCRAMGDIPRHAPA